MQIHTLECKMMLSPILCALTMMSSASSNHFWQFASSPPMGWNSWDCFATTVTEEQTRAQAKVMAEKLKPLGWKYIVVDIQWYEPNATSFDYRKDAKLTLDSFGRLQPAPNRFPSSAGNKGFAALAKHVHSLGLKFGLHLLRGIPRQSVEQNLPIKGTGLHAADIANKTDICPWNPDMYGVDCSKPGAQEYYNSVFEEFADWGVDFVKVDDISRPYHDKEVEAIRNAIDRTGKRIVLSLSPGATPLTAADHVAHHANMWRISDDFWDNWGALVEQFERCKSWAPVTGPGHFPDADMLPLGKIRFGEQTHFTLSEQQTMLSLWSIFRSPLMLGCDLTKLDAATLALITNPEVIRVNQHSHGAMELFRKDDHVAWLSASDKDHEMFVALFNLSDKEADVSVGLDKVGLGNACHIRDLWQRTNLGDVSGEISLPVPAHSSRLISVNSITRR